MFNHKFPYIKQTMLPNIKEISFPHTQQTIHHYIKQPYFLTLIRPIQSRSSIEDIVGIYVIS